MVANLAENDTFNELQYAAELKAFVTSSQDVVVSSEIKLKILNYEDPELLLVKKKISSPTQILDVKPFDDDAVKEAFPSFLSSPTK